MSGLVWLRRDLRRGDHPALAAGWAEARERPRGEIVLVFIVDPALWQAAGPVRRAWVAASVRAVREDFDGRLLVATGNPTTVVPRLAREFGCTSVHVTREVTPAGRRRDAQVAAALQRAGIGWVETGTPYAVGPGIVLNREGRPYQVFTPFRRAWLDHGWPDPARARGDERLAEVTSDRSALQLLERALAEPALPSLPQLGEQAAIRRWHDFRDGALAAYATDRDRPDRDGSSRLSPYLKIGALHPRTLLHDLGGRTGPGVQAFVSELAWREFYADVLWHRPASAWQDLRGTIATMRYDDPASPEVAAAVDAWRAGRTGYPIVDAGMRQLLAEGWMHNRVRMITASFLTKDLHVWWPVGARHFLERLVDGDVASNSHGWQWVAGTGTDAAPYVRVFNPTSQGLRVDPNGDYVRHWVPELSHLSGALAHEPWRAADGYAHGYPAPIVDHTVEREEALSRYAAARAQP